MDNPTSPISHVMMGKTKLSQALKHCETMSHCFESYDPVKNQHLLAEPLVLPLYGWIISEHMMKQLV